MRLLKQVMGRTWTYLSRPGGGGAPAPQRPDNGGGGGASTMAVGENGGGKSGIWPGSTKAQRQAEAERGRTAEKSTTL